MKNHNKEAIERAKRKIRNLLQLAQDSAATSGEVAAAMNRANKLMHEYMLEIDDIETAKEEFQCISKFKDWRKKQRIVISMESQICKAFNCELIYNKYLKRNTIFGVEIDVDTAIYMIDLAHNALDASFKVYRRSYDYARLINLLRISKTTIKNDFIKGFAVAIIQTCDDIIEGNNKPAVDTPTGTSLIVLKNQIVTDEFEKQFPSVKSTKSRIRPISIEGAYDRGNIEGSKVNFRKGIEAENDNQGNTPLLLAN